VGQSHLGTAKVGNCHFGNQTGFRACPDHGYQRIELACFEDHVRVRAGTLATLQHIIPKTVSLFQQHERLDAASQAECNTIGSGPYCPAQPMRPATSQLRRQLNPASGRRKPSGNRNPSGAGQWPQETALLSFWPMLMNAKLMALATFFIPMIAASAMSAAIRAYSI
jgi:hypothetical protein